MSTFNDDGLTVDRYDAIRLRIADSYRSSFGDEIGVDDEDTSVGKETTIISEAIADQNEAIEYIADGFDPDNASGTPLKKLVKLNGLTVNEGLYSTVSLTVVANVYGASLVAGDLVADPNRPEITYALDGAVVLGSYGSDTVSATCTETGANTSDADTVTQIVTTRDGWSSVTNPAAVVPGRSEESSTELRLRRNESARSTGFSSVSGIWAKLADLDNVTDVKVHHNLSNEADSLGVPARNIWPIVLGGSDIDVADVLFAHSPAKTFGNSSQAVSYLTTSYTMYFERPSDEEIDVSVTTSPINPTSPAPYPDDGDLQIKTAIVDWAALNLKLGVNVIASQISAAASIIDGYYIASVFVGTSSPPTSDIVEIDLNERGTIALADISVTAQP